MSNVTAPVDGPEDEVGGALDAVLVAEAEEW